MPIATTSKIEGQSKRPGEKLTTPHQVKPIPKPTIAIIDIAIVKGVPLALSSGVSSQVLQIASRLFGTRNIQRELDHTTSKIKLETPGSSKERSGESGL